MNKTMNSKVDQEWVELLLYAKKMGLTIAEVRQFLREASVPKHAKSHQRGAM